jgi:hypothetical protein
MAEDGTKTSPIFWPLSSSMTPNYAKAKGQPFLLGKGRYENGKRWQSLYDELLLTKDKPLNEKEDENYFERAIQEKR